jgi:Cft2 family RNA processing exonuclease
MQLTDLNPTHDIGANSLLLELGPFRLLVDCGLHPKQIGAAALPALHRLDGAPLDALIVTHAHLDHGGSVPVLLRRHPNLPVLVTQPTQALLPRMLRNSCSVMMRQREELGIASYPLFTFGEIERLEGSLWAQPFGRTRVLEKDGHRLELTFVPAGHVAGAAGVRIVVDDRRIFLTGDVLFSDQLTLTGAKFPDETCDTLITETTRGRTARAAGTTREGERDRLVDAIEQTLAGGGSVLIPVFALGRMQEVLALLHRARSAGRLRPAPLCVSGLGLDLADHLDALARKHKSIRFRRSLLTDLGAQPLRLDLVPGREPDARGIFLISSGMMVEHTPSYAAAAALLGRPRHAVFFVGYCDPATPGGELLATPREGKFRFAAYNYTTPVRARVERFDLSAHADRDELVAFARSRRPRAIVLTHGDPPARAWFADALATLDGTPRVVDPVPGETCSV